MQLKKQIGALLNRIILIRYLPRFFNLHVPPGHFYSPIPSLSQVRASEKIIWPENIPKDLPGVDINISEQLKFFNEFKPFYGEISFPATQSNSSRYYYQNNMFSFSDAFFLYCMIRKVKPQKIVEIGSGFSSGVMMDTNEMFFDNKIKMTFIDPYPSRLLSIMKENDRNRNRILPLPLQSCDCEEFKVLQEDDILFVDSTHISKINSDVNKLLFEILPVLNKGVYIHFHDISYPFEYPREWVYEGRAWNENYILRAFLQYNNSFKIIFFNSFLRRIFGEEFEKAFPLCFQNPGGSLWIRKY